MLESSLTKSGRITFRALILIVLYRLPPRKSTTFRAVLSELGNQALKDEFLILLYDNSETPQACERLPRHVIYHAASRNDGIAGAYNYALELANKEGLSWLLTLDQDTQLPPDFLVQMREIALSLHGNQEVGAIVPQLSDKGRMLSPFRIRPWGISYLSHGFTGTARGEVCALNSASLFRVSALHEIGGFNPYFWLDYQDYYVFLQLHQHGKKVWVAGEIQVKHDLSLLSEDRRPGPDRFRNFLQAESAFCDLYRSSISGLVLTGRLIYRLWRQRRQNVSAEIRQLTGDALKRRLFLTRKQRIHSWQDEMQKRLAGQSKDDQRPVISVCVAAFNGEAYIRQQLQSILDQLSGRDEVIVVDDASTDRTCDVVQSLNAPRIRLKKHDLNAGVLRTFEEAIRMAQGDILFLADQDDLWAPEKVSSVLHTFESNPDADIVVSDATLIDDNGAILGPSYYAVRGTFRSGVLSNIFRCKYLGCTMAFRSSIRNRILPFPANADVLHDIWIGTANSLAGGKTVYIDRPLVLYRRHDNNSTGNTRLSFSRQLRMRWDLCRSLARSWSRLRPRNLL
jgi:glycosyltransferase involved in cell wall biosynthesis